MPSPVQSHPGIGCLGLLRVLAAGVVLKPSTLDPKTPKPKEIQITGEMLKPVEEDWERNLYFVAFGIKTLNPKPLNPIGLETFPFQRPRAEPAPKGFKVFGVLGFRF